MLGEIGYIFNLVFVYPIFNVLMVLYHLFGDLGLSIIVMTLIIRLILFPLNLKQLKSMKATQALQPQMAEIKKKYAKDQQGQAVAMQALYKEYGVNPLSGCLPLLVQLPVLYGLFYALNTAVRATKVVDINAHIYPFLFPFQGVKLPNFDFNWFTFISPAWHFPLAQPDPTHILPVLAALATFVQLRMSQARSANTTKGGSDATAQSMKIMQYIMPVFTLFIGLSFPAGLALYWTVSSVFQAVQQYFITGWGSLMPASFASNGSRNGAVKAIVAEQNRAKAGVSVTEEPRGKIVDSDSPATNHTHATPRSASSSSSTSTRRRGSSASARRRGSTQRSR